MQRLKSESGLTFVEIVVTIGVFTLISLALLQADLSARYAVRNSRTMLEATNVLQTYMEQQRASAYAGLADVVFPAVTLSDSGTADIGDDIVGSVTVDVTDNGDSTKTVFATAAWTERLMGDAVNRSVSLQMLVSEP